MQQTQTSPASSIGRWHPDNEPTCNELRDALALGEEVLVDVAAVDDEDDAWALVTSLGDHEMRSALYLLALHGPTQPAAEAG